MARQHRPFEQLQQIFAKDCNLGASHACVVHCMRRRADALCLAGQKEEAEQLGREADKQQASRQAQKSLGDIAVGYGITMQVHPLEGYISSFDSLDKMTASLKVNDAAPSAPDTDDTHD